ncbi:unnamed protein product, partial [Pelagomonas calceolata]
VVERVAPQPEDVLRGAVEVVAREDDPRRGAGERRRLGGPQRSEAAVHVLVAGAVRRRDAAGALGRDLRVVVEVAGKRRIEGAPPVALRRRERRGRREAAERGAAHALVLGENCAARSFRIDPASAIVVERQEGAHSRAA